MLVEMVFLTDFLISEEAALVGLRFTMGVTA